MRALEICKKCDNLRWFFAFSNRMNNETWRFKKQRNGFYEAHGKNVTLFFQCRLEQSKNGEPESSFILENIPKRCSYKMEHTVLLGGDGQTIFEDEINEGEEGDEESED